MKKFLHHLLNVYLCLYLADAMISVLDDALLLIAGTHLLSNLRMLTGFFAMLLSATIYLLMGLTPMVPKRFFLPLTLFPVVSILAGIPLYIYHHTLAPWISLGIAICQLGMILGLLAWIQCGWKFRTPIFRLEQMGVRSFGWLNTGAFLGGNILILFPLSLIYLAFCCALAVEHFSAGFLTLHADRLAAHSRKYVRNDGRTIQLIPMMHIGRSDFYREISRSFPSNSVILVEGVTDKKHHLKTKLSYKRAASVVGLSEQQDHFTPQQGKIVHADVDVNDFSKSTINFLNAVAMIHAKGLTPETLQAFLQQSQDPEMLEHKILKDILDRRNEHLLKIIREELPGTSLIVVPWGALHMPGISREITMSGFHPGESREYSIIRFGNTSATATAATKKTGL